MPFDTAFLGQLRKRIEEERLKATNLIIGGRCADHSEYRYSCGYIKALDDVMTFSEEILTDAQKG